MRNVRRADITLAKMFTPKRAILILVLIGCFLPVFLPDDYSGFEGEKKDIAKFAIDEASWDGVLIWRYKVSHIEKIDISGELPAWKVVLVGYTYFNIPIKKVEIDVMRKSDRYQSIGGSFNEYFPGADLIVWVFLPIFLVSIITLFLIPVFLLYYIVKRTHKKTIKM